MLSKNLGRLVSGLPVVETPAPLVATLDSVTTRPVAVLESDQLEEDANLVAERVVDERHFAMRRHTAFLVIEVATVPEPTLRFRTGVVGANQSIQVGRARDLSESAFQAERERVARRESRTRARLAASIGRASVGRGTTVTSATGVAFTD